MTFMRMRMRLYGALHEVAERGLALLHADDPALRARLQEHTTCFSRIEEEMPRILGASRARGMREGWVYGSGLR